LPLIVEGTEEYHAPFNEIFTKLIEQLSAEDPWIEDHLSGFIQKL
jgi:hypothetical protein